VLRRERTLRLGDFSLAQLPAKPGRALNFEPVLDGQIIPRHPFDPVANSLNASVPLIVGNVATESSAFMLRGAAGLQASSGTTSRTG
jgi:para-nitrobenzyl esterase